MAFTVSTSIQFNLDAGVNISGQLYIKQDRNCEYAVTAYVMDRTNSETYRTEYVFRCEAAGLEQLAVLALDQLRAYWVADSGLVCISSPEYWAHID